MDELWESITIIQAQELLSYGKIGMWPHIKHEEYSKQHKEMHKLAYPGTYGAEKKNFITPEQLQARLARG